MVSQYGCIFSLFFTGLFPFDRTFFRRRRVVHGALFLPKKRMRPNHNQTNLRPKSIVTRYHLLGFNNEGHRRSLSTYCHLRGPLPAVSLTLSAGPVPTHDMFSFEVLVAIAPMQSRQKGCLFASSLTCWASCLDQRPSPVANPLPTSIAVHRHSPPTGPGT